MVWIEKSVTRDHSSTSLGKPCVPISDPRDRYFYPRHTPMKDTYSLAHGLRQFTRDVKNDVRTLDLRSDVIFAPLRKHRMTFGKGRYATFNVKNERHDG